MVMLQRAPQMLQCTPPTRKRIDCIYETKLHICTRQVRNYCGKRKVSSEHEVDLHNMRKSKSVTLCPALPYSSLQCHMIDIKNILTLNDPKLLRGSVCVYV